MSRESDFQVKFNAAKQQLLGRIEALRDNLNEECNNLRARSIGGHLPFLKSAAVFFRAPRSFTLFQSSRNDQFKLKQNKIRYLNKLRDVVNDMQYGVSLDGTPMDRGEDEYAICDRQRVYLISDVNKYPNCLTGITSRVSDLVNAVAHLAAMSVIFGSEQQVSRADVAGMCS